MLFEMECDAFATKVDGVLVPRGKITFYEGLNTILGDKQAQNSIGKSTFLLIVDFCFGGDDYKKNNAKTKVGNHTIKCEVDPAAPYWLSPAVSAEPPPEPDLHVSAYPAPSAITITVLGQV